MDAKIKSNGSNGETRSTREKVERSYRQVTSAQSFESGLKRDKVASANLATRSGTAEPRAVNGLRYQRSRAQSNLETSSIKRTNERIGAPRSRSSVEPDAVNPKPRRKISASGLVLPRPQTGILLSGAVTPRAVVENGHHSSRKVSRESSHDRASLSSSEGESTGETNHKKLGRTKSGPAKQTRENGYESNQAWDNTRKSRRSSDNDVKRTRKISAGNPERREIIEKYVKASPEANDSKNIPHLQESKKQDDSEADEKKGSGRGWGLLRKKLLEAARQDSTEDSTEDATIEEEEKHDEVSGKEASTTYWKMLRERLRNCQPADIVASSDVDEIARRKQDLERRRSTNKLGNGKNSFFETVLTAHALSKQNRLEGGLRRKSSTSSLSRSARSDSLQSLPEIGYSSKFKASPHFQRTMDQIMGIDEVPLEGDQKTQLLERPKTLTSRYTF